MTTTPDPTLADTPKTLPVAISIEGHRVASIAVDGQDVTSQVMSLRIDAEAATIPTVELDLAPKAALVEVEGVVQVNRHAYDTAEDRAGFFAMVEGVIRSGLDLDELRARVETKCVTMADDPLRATCEAVADLFAETIKTAGL